MKRKLVILIVLLIVASLIVVAIVNVRKKENITKSIIVLTYPKDINQIDTLSMHLLDSFSSKTLYPYKFTINKSASYLDYLKTNLIEPDKSDLYFVVNNNYIHRPEITNPAYDFSLSDRYFKKIPPSFKTLSQVGDRFSYIPVTWSPWGVYYNKNKFKELGLEEPKTYKEFVEICNLIIADGRVPFSMIQRQKWPFTSWFEYISIRKYGANFHDNLLDGRISFTSDEVQNIFEILYSLIQEGWFYEDLNTTDWNVMVNTLVNGETLMALSSTFFYDSITEDEQKNIGWFKFPLIDKSVDDEIVTSSGFVVSGSTNNLKGVKDFCKFLLSDGQYIISRNTDFYPIHNKIIKKSKRDDLVKGYKSAVKSQRLLPSFERNNKPELLNPLKSSINRLFYIDDKEDIEELLIVLEEFRLEINK